MPVIKLQTRIKSDIDICFDLSRSVELHQISTSSSREKVVGGVMKGLMGFNDSVTWEATHFGVRQRLTARITALEKPFHFRDEMVEGAFKSFSHDHFFVLNGDQVIMEDVFSFETPFNIFGELFNSIMLTRYMTRLLSERNAVIKEYAETDKWKTVLFE
ncbi:cell division protein [Emticicia sp. CRIBPO]|uniref:SRPBCC family protein n=1 Tax=Emticicia sp. CRIBPO TaxID=2683258 RepID=UPI001413744B|nr:SRPBCC family protein [Emticicia sp. CRIBPO]NBA84300.1 cell division protein [Emticicia sp. CRIBPO]